MLVNENDPLRIQRTPQLRQGTLLLAFDGWMDGGDVSTGTVQRMVDILEAEPVAEIDPDSFYLFNFPGSMELTSLFRPKIHIQDGLIQSIEMPSAQFSAYEDGNLLLFIAREPNLRWKAFGDLIFRFAHDVGIKRILFVGSFGGTVPHTREPRLYVNCSEERLLEEMKPYGTRRTGYQGPGSFTSYLMTRAPTVNLEMISLVVEIPGYLQGPNPVSIEAVTRRLAKILQLHMDLDELRAESTEWEMRISGLVEEDADLARRVRQLEEEYDNDLLENSPEE